MPPLAAPLTNPTRHTGGVTIIDAVASGSDAVLVTWSDSDDDAEQSAVIDLEWQPAERDTGTSAGWLADGDAPEDVLSYAAEWASDRARDQYEDAQDQDGAW